MVDDPLTLDISCYSYRCMEYKHDRNLMIVFCLTHVKERFDNITANHNVFFYREHSFWTHGTNGMLERTHRSPNVRVPNARYPFEVTLHQGAIERIFLDVMSTRDLLVDRPTTISNWEILTVAEASDDYRIKVTLRHLLDNVEGDNKQLENNVADSTTKNTDNENRMETIIHAKYVIGCDGAHSWVRKKLGFTMIGENTGK